MNLLETNAGPLDALQEIGSGWRFEDVRKRSVSRTLGGRPIFVLSLAANIESKESAGRPKDRAVLPILIATLNRRPGE